MKRALITHKGVTQWVVAKGGELQLASGECINPAQVERWWPPLPEPLDGPRTILALGLNYADHAKELAFKAPTEPLVFLKGENALTGHDARSVRPPDATFMHYECELAVVIGKTCKSVAQADAYAVIEGYTVANDYAVRDHLENWYRPNLKVKNRDRCTPVGPFLVDATDVFDPMNLRLTTTVNGVTTQKGNTANMVFSIPWLIAYFTSFMTLRRGDIILTGTPDGVVNCAVGDDIVTTIECVGSLRNTLV